MRGKLRTPVTYYGGKQRMLQHILPNIPEHEIYTEAFFGGGAVFFAKEPAKVEIVNDLNGEVINFYRVLQLDFWKLNEMIQCTLHSRELYRDAQVVYDSPHLFDNTRRAWAFWILTNQGFGAKIGSWGYDKHGVSMVRRLAVKKEELCISLRSRMEFVQIECNDALAVLRSRDSEDSFHYTDPPYVGSDQGHYRGFSEGHYAELLETMKALKGKFLQSSYWSKLLEQYVNDNGWYVLKFEKPISASLNKGRRKMEVLVANYPLQR